MKECLASFSELFHTKKHHSTKKRVESEEEREKSYVVASSGFPKMPLDVNDWLDGKYDMDFKSATSGYYEPSNYFDCDTYPSPFRKSAFQKHLRDCRDLKGTYVFEMGYPLDIMLSLVGLGYFSKAVERAVNCKDESDVMENKNFDPNLLEIQEIKEALSSLGYN